MIMKTAAVAVLGLIASATVAMAQAPRVPTGIEVEGPAFYRIDPATNRVLVRRAPCTNREYAVRDAHCPITGGEHGAADTAKDTTDAGGPSGGSL